MQIPVNFAGVERILRVLGREWRGEWQREAARAICEHDEVVFQAARQASGKTWTVGLMGAAKIISGGTITIGYPSMTQATRLLSEQVISNLNNFNVAMSQSMGRPFFKKPKQQSTYQRWALADDPSHEGKYYALSANEISRSKPEGYTTDHLYLDEAHRLTRKTSGIFEPFLDVAALRGDARCVYMGVGGHRQSLIEQKKHEPDVKVVYWPASKIVEVAPEWEPVFEKRRASLSSWQWRQHYECLPATEGMLLMFPDEIPEEISIEDWKRRGLTPELFFGIDVGKVIDSTVVKVIAVIRGPKGLIINEIDTFEISGISYTDQAAAIYEWVDARYFWRPENIIVELNGVGEAFFDILNAGPFRNIRGIFTTADLKEQFWHMMNVMIREGRFGCKNEDSRLHYGGMMYENVQRGGKFVIDFEHSDYWMGLCMAFAGLSEIEAL